MYLLNPSTALDLARFRVDQDIARAEAHRIAREARTARKAGRKAARPEARPEAPTARPRGRRATAVRGAAMRFGH